MIKTFHPRRSKFRQNAFSSSMGGSPPSSSAFSDEIDPRRVLQAFHQKAGLPLDKGNIIWYNLLQFDTIGGKCMKKRIICFVLVLAMAAAMIPAVTAAEHGMVDIVGHWAENDIAWVIDMGLFNGTSATTFNPNGSMTRGMFVTVLGRFAGIDPDDYEDWYLPDLYKDVDADTYYGYVFIAFVRFISES